MVVMVVVVIMVVCVAVAVEVLVVVAVVASGWLLTSTTMPIVVLSCSSSSAYIGETIFVCTTG